MNDMELGDSVDQLHPRDTVWVPDRQSSATVTGKIAPRSYTVDTSNGRFRRNRIHLLTTPGDESSIHSSSHDVSNMDQENADISDTSAGSHPNDEDLQITTRS